MHILHWPLQETLPWVKPQSGGSAGNGDEGREASACLIASLKISPQVLGYWHTPPETGRERVSKVQSLFWSET